MKIFKNNACRRVRKTPKAAAVRKGDVRTTYACLRGLLCIYLCLCLRTSLPRLSDRSTHHHRAASGIPADSTPSELIYLMLGLRTRIHVCWACRRKCISDHMVSRLPLESSICDAKTRARAGIRIFPAAHTACSKFPITLLSEPQSVGLGIEGKMWLFLQFATGHLLGCLRIRRVFGSLLLPACGGPDSDLPGSALLCQLHQRFISFHSTVSFPHTHECSSLISHCALYPTP